MSDWLRLIVSIVVCELTGLFGGIFTASSVKTWYANLNKPALNPPSWVFGPVWTTLYALMGISAFLVWRKGLDKEGVKTALAVFIVQLVLNSSWSFAFFGAHSPLSGLIIIVLMLIAIAATIFLFSRISPLAALLLVPYIIWVSFATYLTAGLWWLNR